MAQHLRRRIRELLWLTATLVVTAALAALPLLGTKYFYYVDDSQSSAFGQWFHIGERILAGDFTALNPSVWQSGNYLAESAWGVYSPILWVIGVGAVAAGTVSIYVTIVKVAFLVVAAGGVFLLARSYGASAPWSALAGVAATLSGVTVYLDGASWANGLMGWALLPLAWSASRQVVTRAWPPILGILACGLLIGISYVHATLMLATVLVALFVESLVRRRRPEIIRSLLLGGSAAAMTIIVHLPGLLTSPVTGRASEVANSGTLTVNLSALVSSWTAVGTSQVNLFGTQFPSAPLTYTAWFLPLLAFVAWRRGARLVRERLSILITLGVAAIIALGPSDLGPLRFPIRMLPFVVLCVLVILAVLLTQAPAVPGRRRIRVAVVAVGVGAVFAWAQGPQYSGWILLCAALSAFALVVMARLLRTPTGPMPTGWRGSTAARFAAAVAVALVLTGVLTAVQRHLAPRSPLLDYGLPAATDTFRELLDEAEGEALVVGSPLDPRRSDAAWEETSVGNMWYISDAVVQNSYSAVYYPGYSSALCMGYNGLTCGELYEDLFEDQPETDLPLVDLMGVSTVQIIKASVPAADRALVPEGWHVVDDTPWTRTIVRNEPVPGAGGVVWTSEGVEAEAVSVTPERVEVDVEATTDDGVIAFSRIPWPGYEVSAGRVLDEPIDNFLLQIDVSDVEPGQTVVLEFVPPGRSFQVLAAVTLGLLLVGWTSLWAVVRLRPGRSRLLEDLVATARDE